MAGPSTVAQSDSLMAMRAQLHEAGAGEVSLRSLLDLPQHANPDPKMQHDVALACDLTSAELALARDSAIAHRLAVAESGLTNSAEETAVSDVMLSNHAVPPVTCPICLELAPPALRFQSTSCEHVFCTPCMRKHLCIVALETHQFPIMCPSCRAELDPQACLEILAGTGAAYDAMERLILEQQHYGCIRYCSNANCAIAFDWDDDPSVRHYADRFKVTCPLCNEATCVECKVKWHEGQTCAQYTSEKEVSDALVRLAKENKWMECPKCGLLIDRRKGDCNFVKCRCGCGFCHKCGKEYLSLAATLNNTHGRSNCRCGLFDEDDEAPQDARPGDAAPQIELGEDQRAALQEAVEELRERLHERLGAFIEEDDDDAHARPLARYNDMRDELEDFTEGDNGYVGLLPWLQGTLRRGRRLPNLMAEDVRRGVCPYFECQQQFISIKALEQHLVAVRWHPVFLCCGRPFGTANGYERHRAAVHG